MTRYPCLHIEGGLLGGDLLEAIAAGNAPGQKPADFGLEAHVHLSDEIAAAWSLARTQWGAFQTRLERLRPDDPATSETRSGWLIPLLSLLGYDPVYVPRGEEVDGKAFAVSHRADAGEGAPPLHLVGCRQSLDRRADSGPARQAPHSLLQDYLNRSEALWGIVSNGITLRLLRDSQLLRRMSYLEFDLQAMFEGEKYADFGLLFRLLQRSRLPRSTADADACWLEQYYRQTIEQGGRVRERLRDGVEQALLTLGNGFLVHARNSALRERVAGGLGAPGYYEQILRLIYRLLFLMVAEERGLVSDNAVYREHYSVGRLRRLLDVRAAWSQHTDLWQGLQTTFRLLDEERLGSQLGIPTLNGDLFGSQAIRDLNALTLSNHDLLSALWHLSMFREGERAPWRRIHYAALDVEELGSVYESLLDFQPTFDKEDAAVRFDLVAGTERKSTGSYYTRPELVHELIQSALEPVIAERLAAGADSEAKGLGTPVPEAERRGPRSVPPQAGLRRLPSEAGDAPRQRRGEGLEAALLSIKVCDPAAGSGHFLLAAARRIGQELARVRAGGDEPAPDQVRAAVRDAITHCLYGVDLNPLAVDLCKVALWIEGHCRGKPLTFLDHRIRCGNSLVGVLELKVPKDGIPDAAFKPVSGDDPATARSLARRNKEERLQHAFPLGTVTDGREDAGTLESALRLPDDTPGQVQQKARAFGRVRAEGHAWWQRNTAAHLWTAAFFCALTPAEAKAGRIPTNDALRRYRRTGSADGRTVGAAWALAQQHHFFHWPLEFPEVFHAPSPGVPRGEGRGEGGQGDGQQAEGFGFDVVLGNPPWEMLQVEEQEFFASRDPRIAAMPGEQRKKAIERLRQENPALAHEFEAAKHSEDAQNKFLRASGRFRLTATGKLNTYALFAELARLLLAPTGRAGIIVPTGIATDDGTKDFFGDVAKKHALSALLDFENREKLFPSVDSRTKFCLLTVSGKPALQADLAFFATRVEHLRDERRRIRLSAEDIALLNPNTGTLPVLRTRADADLTRAIYSRVPVLVNESTGENPWGVTFRQGLFNMTSDSKLFVTVPRAGYVPLYEAKLMHQFDHRWATYAHGGVRDLTPEEKADPHRAVQPRYWVQEAEVEARLGEWSRGWLLGFRDITNATNERTVIFSVLPRVGVGNKVPVLQFGVNTPALIACFVGCTNSMPLDYVARQKVAGTTLNFFIIKQFAVLPPAAYTPADIAFIAPRVLELVYTAWDVRPFADDVWQDANPALRAALRQQGANGAALSQSSHGSGVGGREASPVRVSSPPCGANGPELPRSGAGGGDEGVPYPPFRWNDDRRALLRAELDAYYARLYGLSRDELRYILDPQDVHGPDFPGETFRVLKEKETRLYGEYRTRQLVLEAWDRV